MGSDQVLVLGGTGFIGRHVVRVLLAKGHAVRVMTRQLTEAHPLFPKKVEIIQGCLTSHDDLERAVDGCSSVINVAGCYRFGPSSARQLQESNVDGVKNLLAVWQGRFGRLVHVSTAGFWEQADDGNLSRADLPRCAFYKRTKRAGEQAVLEAVESGMDAVVVNPTCPVGAEDHLPTPTGRIIYDFIRGRFPVGCRTGINLIHVADLADGIVQAWLKAPAGGPVILGDENLWIDQIFDRCQQWVDRAKPAVVAPHGLIRLMGEVGELLDKVKPGFSQQTQLCRETAWLSTRAQFFDLSETQQTLDWKPGRGVDEGLREAIEFFREESELESVPMVENQPFLENGNHG